MMSDLEGKADCRVARPDFRIGPNPDIALEQFIERFIGCWACKAAEGRAVLYLRPRAAGRLRGIKS